MALLDINLPPKTLLSVVGNYVPRAADLSRFVSRLFNITEGKLCFKPVVASNPFIFTS
jgi:hypothetical protein